MGLKHIIRQIIRIRTHFHNLQKNYFIRPLYYKYTGITNTQQFLPNTFQRNFCTENNNNDYLYTSDSEELENDDLDDTKLNIRNILYKNSKDPLIQELNECASVQDVFNIIRKNNDKMDHVHVSQAVLVLWDLQKIFYNHNIYFEHENEITGDSRSSSELNANAILKKYISQVSSHEDFDTLIHLVTKNYENFSLDALTCTLLYLNRMGVAIKSNVMQLIISRCEKEIKNCDKNTFPLTALSRFIVTINRQNNFYPIDALPIVLQRLESCDSEEDFKLLTICLYRMKQLLTMNHIDTYKKITEILIDEKKITNQNPRTILKAIRFLTNIQWYECNIQCTNKLMLLLQNSLSQLSSREILTMFKVFQMQKEPAVMLDELQQHALRQVSFLEKESNNSLETILDLLSCVVLFSSPQEKPRFEKLTRRYIQNNLSAASLGALYKILYHIKSSDEELCNKFWDKLYETIVKGQKDLLQNILILCLKYIHFTQDIGHKYRYIKFEQNVIDILMKELNTNDLYNTINVEKFVRIASFIIAYNKDRDFDEKLIDQLLEKSQQLSSIDVLNISKGIQFAFEHKYKYTSEFAKRVQLLNNALNENISRTIQHETKLSTINVFLRSYVIRKCNTEDDLFKDMLQNFVKQSRKLNSHIIKDLSFYLQIYSYLEPDVINEMTEYIIENNDKILGGTIEKVLQLCYFLGYCPTNSEDFLETASRIIVRDQERFTGLTFLQTSLALCYFHKLPEILIKHIFSVDFLEQLDEELANCYAKTTYPIRVRDYMMQLNRAVCLDYPQSNVPWFHGKYTEQSKKQISRDDFLHKQVFATLQEVLKDKNHTLNLNTYSPYGYHLDFELTNKENEAIKTAILLLKPKSFTNRIINLKGYYQLRQRHLEILGYNVININDHDWKTFCIQQDCIEYVRNKLSVGVGDNASAILSTNLTRQDNKCISNDV